MGAAEPEGEDFTEEEEGWWRVLVMAQSCFSPLCQQPRGCTWSCTLPLRPRHRWWALARAPLCLMLWEAVAVLTWNALLFRQEWGRSRALLDHLGLLGMKIKGSPRSFCPAFFFFFLFPFLREAPVCCLCAVSPQLLPRGGNVTAPVISLHCLCWRNYFIVSFSYPLLKF